MEKVVRLPVQVLVLLFQIYFAVQTILLYNNGHIRVLGQPMSSFYSIIFTLIIVFASEIASFFDAILFIVISRKNVFMLVYSLAYLVLIIINAIFFLTMMYNTETGTIVCYCSYALLFVLRILNFALNLRDVVKKAQTPKT